MGVDYDGIGVIGFQIKVFLTDEQEERGDCIYEFLDKVLKDSPYSYTPAGDGGYGGEDRWYIGINKPEENDWGNIPEKRDELHRFIEQLGGVEIEGEFGLHEDLHVW